MILCDTKAMKFKRKRLSAALKRYYSDCGQRTHVKSAHPLVV